MLLMSKAAIFNGQASPMARAHSDSTDKRPLSARIAWDYVKLPRLATTLRYTGPAKNGSEQESVKPPGFIGFPGFGTVEPTGFDDLGSELPPMFTGLSAHSCVDRRHLRKSPGFRPCRRATWPDAPGGLKRGASSTRLFNRMLRLR
jgi:hypothetical protein